MSLMKMGSFVITTALLFPYSAMALTESNSGYNLHEGPYVAADFKYAQSPKAIEVAGGHHAEHGFGLLAGYQFSPYLAAEIGAAHTYESDWAFSNGVMIYHVVAKGVLPFDNNQRFSLFGKLGVARIGISPHDNMFDHQHKHIVEMKPLFGVGAEFAMTKNLGATLEYNGIPLSKNTYNNGEKERTLFSMVNVGLIYHIPV